MLQVNYRRMIIGGAALLGLAAGAGPLLAGECLDCHAEVMTQLGGSSHHIQGVAISSRHCYACHWEATPQGAVDERYHRGHAKALSTEPGPVDLVVWGAGQRPTVHTPGSTAVTFRPTAIGTDRERVELAQITRHCLACHSDQNNTTQPFAGDDNTPRTYAWDRQSIASRYAQRATTSWGKYSTAATNKKKQVIKAFSAHGNAAANQGGWDAAVGYDGAMPATRGGSAANNVECFDCHNAHGSTVAGITASYRSDDGRNNGGLLKATRAGVGGYRMTYSPSVNADRQSSNPFNAGAGLCFDCHESATAGNTPWGYRSTFGVTQPILGYKDTLKFGHGNKGSTGRFANRQSRTEIVSSHLKAGQPLVAAATGQVNGLCTSCHDPHGVSRTIGDQMPYGVPLLKGPWLTSPYQEDGPPTGAPGRTWSETPRQGESRGVNRGTGNLGEGAGGAPREPMPGMKYNVDRNTFGEERRIMESAETFGGICLQCHARESLTGQSAVGQIHRAVKGWGNNKEHAFPCAKCHQAHSSGLPRLMQTNCFEQGPAGLREKSGLPWLPFRKGAGQRNWEGEAPVSAEGSKAKNKVVGCHVRQFGRTATAFPPGRESSQWNSVTSW